MAVNNIDVYVGGCFFNVNNNGTMLPYADYAAHAVDKNVDVYIGGAFMGGYDVPQGSSMRQSYGGVSNGPVRVTSTNNANLVASTRVIYGGAATRR